MIENGRVWTGSNFEERIIYISQGRFVDQEPDWIDVTIDAQEKFLVPPFGDYHTHIFDGEYAQVADSIFLSKGIFFSQDLVNDPVGRKRNESFLKRSETVDIAFANGCLTSDFGHPIEGYERMALGINWPRTDGQRDSIRNSRLMEGRTYHIVNRASDLPEVMNRLLSSQPNLIKVILWNSIEYTESADFPVANKGLDPSLIPAILEYGNRYNLPVVAHVHTEDDFRIAMDKGLRYFAHAPLYGYGVNGQVSADYPRLSGETRDLLEQKEVVVNPTLYRTFKNIQFLPDARKLTEEQQRWIKDFHRQLLTDLKDSGAAIVAGADSPGLDGVDEVIYYQHLGVFSPSELLKMLIQTSTYIFPDRKIGRIAEGYEANLLLLDKNPLENIENATSIKLHIKGGEIFY